MSDPMDSETPRRTQKPKTAAAADEPAAAGEPAPAPAPAPRSAAPSASPSASSSGAAAGPSSTAQISGVVSDAMSAVRARLQLGEQLLLVGAGLVVLVYVLFIVIFGSRTFAMNDMAVVTSVLALAAVWVHRWGHHDFGTAYRIVVGALGITLAIFAVTNFLTYLRFGGGAADAVELIARIVLWAAGIIAGYGAWLVWRTGR